MSVICGQPYSEMSKIPVELSLKAQQRFFKILDHLFELFKTAMPDEGTKLKTKLESLPHPSTWSPK